MPDNGDSPFERQLIVALRAILEPAVEPVDAESIVSELATAEHGHPAISRWRVALTVAATVLVAVVGGSVAVRLLPSGDRPSPSPITSVVPRETSEPTPSASPRAPLTPNAAAAQVMRGLSGEPQLAGITTTSTPSGLEVAIMLTRNDDGVPDVWLADLAVGAVGELVHSDQAVANDLISSATAVGPGDGGDPITTYLGVGAVRLGQVFGSPSDSTLAARVADVAKRYGLEVADLQILHPLESALRVTFVVPKGATIDWTIDALGTALVGTSPDVEGVLIELDDSDGQPLLQSGVAYRTGEGGLWFAPGQDERFGAVHGGTPGN